MNQEENICAVCLEEVKYKSSITMHLSCEHYFHKDCIKDWMDKKGTCPCCRDCKTVFDCILLNNRVINASFIDKFYKYKLHIKKQGLMLVKKNKKKDKIVNCFSYSRIYFVDVNEKHLDILLSNRLFLSLKVKEPYKIYMAIQEMMNS